MTPDERREAIYRVARSATYASDETSVNLAVDALIEAGFISLEPTLPAVQCYVLGPETMDSPEFSTREEAEAYRDQYVPGDEVAFLTKPSGPGHHIVWCER